MRARNPILADVFFTNSPVSRGPLHADSGISLPTLSFRETYLTAVTRSNVPVYRFSWVTSYLSPFSRNIDAIGNPTPPKKKGKKGNGYWPYRAQCPNRMLRWQKSRSHDDRAFGSIIVFLKARCWHFERVRIGQC